MSQHKVQSFLDSSPFIHFLGIRVEQLDVDAGTLTLKMAMKPELERIPATGQYHGGVLASFIDTAGAVALIMQREELVATIDLRVDYLRPATGAFLLAQATVRRHGRNVGVVDIDVIDDEERLVAIGRASFMAQPGTESLVNISSS